MLIEKKEEVIRTYSTAELESGQVYECVSDGPNHGYYHGWVLFANHYGDLRGVWLNDTRCPGAVLADGTIGQEYFKFRKMQVKLVEL
jgi:hypothetical protein